MELILVWNGFKVLHRTPDLVEPMLKLVQKSLVELEGTKDENENYMDDWCLGKLLQGMCYRCVNKPKEAMESLLNAVNRSKDLVHDFYLAPYACAEVGFLHLEEGDLDQAKEFLNKARIHSALQEIKHRRKQAKEASKLEKQLAKRSKNGVNNNNTPSPDVDSISISLEESSLARQDSNASFETAPEYSSEDERDLGETDPDSHPKETTVRETTV
ncbi:Tetratricopeptide repeat protein 39B [Desmophyllum pertusum]|uniref:Tetratricopeptide repeat protein 39B n=1 Tax=Desmophyllum pertusum TaxID=174260 RepID=A0A9W9ZV28_9CNID|nr:Tetratricopeptide repeat protein 39B [Desmophyllum pertusum]